MRQSFVWILVLLLCTSSLEAKTKKPKKQPPSKEQAEMPLGLTDRFEHAWAKTFTFEAAFTQTIHYKQLEDTETSSGHIWVNKPSHVRWDEETSTQKISQILNGNRLSVLTERVRRPGSRTIDVWENGLKYIDKAAFAFLSERALLSKAYELTLKSDSETAFSVELKPKSKKGEPLVAEMLKDGYRLRALSTSTPESTVMIEFSDVGMNKGVSPQVFEWKENKDGEGKSLDTIHRHND